MFQDLELAYDNSFRAELPSDEGIALIYRGDAVLACAEDAALRLPRFSELPASLRAIPFRYAFTLGEDRCFLADAANEPLEAANGLRLIPSREYRNAPSRAAVFAAAVGESLHRWYCSNRFCGRCGRPMRDSSTERALVCPDCGLTVYPKICPAVIVAVTDGDRLLLTKYQGRSFKRFALVAGFHEIGKPLRTRCAARSWKRPACA